VQLLPAATVQLGVDGVPGHPGIDGLLPGNDTCLIVE
jgi:hypothetical protein